MTPNGSAGSSLDYVRSSDTEHSAPRGHTMAPASYNGERNSNFFARPTSTAPHAGSRTLRSSCPAGAAAAGPAARKLEPVRSARPTHRHVQRGTTFFGKFLPAKQQGRRNPMSTSDQGDVRAWLQRLFDEPALLFRRKRPASLNSQDLHLSRRNNTISGHRSQLPRI